MCGCLHAPLILGTWPATQACALTGNRTSDPLIHRPAHNALSHASQSHLFFFSKMQDSIEIDSQWGGVKTIVWVLMCE